MSTDLALAADPGFIERSADPGEFVIQACERAKVWLREALENGDIDQITEIKSVAETVRVYTMQKQLGKDAQLSATEIVRRAERGIGVAIRRGQESGEVVKHGHRPKRLGDNESFQPRPVTDFASHSELGGNRRQPGIYDLADNVSDEDFETAVAEAKAEENLSRANLARKTGQRKTTAPRPVHQEAAPRPRKRRDPLAGTLLNCVIQLQGTIDRLELELQDGFDDSVTPEMAGGWVDDLTGVIRPLSRLRSLLKEKASG